VYKKNSCNFETLTLTYATNTRYDTNNVALPSQQNQSVT